MSDLYAQIESVRPTIQCAAELCQPVPDRWIQAKPDGGGAPNQQAIVTLGLCTGDVLAMKAEGLAAAATLTVQMTDHCTCSMVCTLVRHFIPATTLELQGTHDSLYAPVCDYAIVSKTCFS